MKRNDQPIATFDRVTKKFRRLRAVDDVTFAVMPGEVVGLVGDDESGKTTLISLLMGFSKPSEGAVTVGGHKLKLPTAHRLHHATGYAAYDTALPSSMTGEKYLQAVVDRRRATADQYTKLVRAFRPDLSTPIGALSAVQQQKIALVAAFLGSPTLIVLDEPVRGLDALSRDVLLDAVRTASHGGAAVVVSSQYPSEIDRVCSRLLLLQDGTVAHDLSAQAIATHTGKNVTIYTDDEIALPPGATSIRTGSRHKIKFSYTGTTAALLGWLQTLADSDIQDIEIEPRSLDDEFGQLYADPEESVDE